MVTRVSRTSLAAVLAAACLIGAALAVGDGAAPADAAPVPHLPAPESFTGGWMTTTVGGHPSTVAVQPQNGAFFTHETEADLCAPGADWSCLRVELQSEAGFVVGTTYSSDAGDYVWLTAQSGAGAQLCGGQHDPSTFVLDQLQVTDFSAGQGDLDVLAARFSCQAGATHYTGAFAIAASPTTPGEGYYLRGADGSMTGFGNDHYLTYLDAPGTTAYHAPVVGVRATDDGGGYWLVGADGGVFAYGDARFEGSMGGRLLAAPVVGMAPTPDDGGYWLVAADGGVFAFGDARFEGSMGGRHLAAPVVGMAAAPDGGYWLVAADGGVFAFGGAAFEGSTGGTPLNAPVVALTPGPDGGGYRLAAADGGVFAFGDAHFQGSAAGARPSGAVTGMLASPDGTGYWLTDSTGQVFAFGAPDLGDLSGTGVSDIMGITG